jgi:hypothetical protein
MAQSATKTIRERAAVCSQFQTDGGDFKAGLRAGLLAGTGTRRKVFAACPLSSDPRLAAKKWAIKPPDELAIIPNFAEPPASHCVAKPARMLLSETAKRCQNSEVISPR